MTHILRINEYADNTPTNVMFRKDKDGDVVAILDEWWNESDGEITCYSHIGQHGGCVREWVEKETVPANRNEYMALLSELERQGYDNLAVVDTFDDFTIFGQTNITF